jgi:hypothetical protein
MQSINNLVYLQLLIMNDVTEIVVVHILGKEERDEQLINLLFTKKNKNKKKNVHIMFTVRRNEGAIACNHCYS